jgi:hypothetical protein
MARNRNFDRNFSGILNLAKKGDGAWVAPTMAGFKVIAATKTGLFLASSEEESYGRAIKMGGEAGATTMAGFGMVAAIKVGLFCASSEEEGFVRATEMKEGGVGVAATMAGFGGAATRGMMASKAEEVAEAMAGFGGAATSQMMATMAEEVAAAKAGLGFFMPPPRRRVLGGRQKRRWRWVPQQWRAPRRRGRELDEIIDRPGGCRCDGRLGIP